MNKEKPRVFCGFTAGEMEEIRRRNTRYFITTVLFGIGICADALFGTLSFMSILTRNAYGITPYLNFLAECILMYYFFRFFIDYNERAWNLRHWVRLYDKGVQI